MSGRSHSENTKIKMSSWERPTGASHWSTGRKHSDKSKAKMSAGRKGKRPSIESVDRMKATKKAQGDSKGERNPFFGKKHPAEIQQAINAKNRASLDAKLMEVGLSREEYFKRKRREDQARYRARKKADST